MFHYFQSAGDWVVLVVLFGLCIFVHELGHFLAARALGMVVDTFSLGFGPAIWKKKVNGTTYKIAWLPLGGYVSIPQLDPSGMEALQGQTEQAADKLPPVPPWKRILVCLAGPTGNILLAVVLAWIVYLAPETPAEDASGGTRIGWVETNSLAYAAGLRAGDEILAVNGEPVARWSKFQVETHLRSVSNQVDLTVRSGTEERTLTIPTIENDMEVHVVSGVSRGLGYMVGEVIEGKPAQAAGMQPGDIVKSVNGIPVFSQPQFSDILGHHRDEEVAVVVERSGQQVELKMTPRYDAERDMVMVGVRGGSVERGVPMWLEHKEPFAQIKADANSIFRILAAFGRKHEAKKALDGLGGFILIVATLWATIQESFINAFAFLRFLNVNLALLNLLPIPVLDGGHIMFFLWEMITRRKPHPKVVHYATNAVAALLIVFFIYIFFRDIERMNKLNWLKDRPAAAAVSNAAPPVATGDTPVAVSTGAASAAQEP